MMSDHECDGCGEVFADEDDFELHPCPANPANRRQTLTVSVVYPCGHTVSVMVGRVLTGDCAACATGIPAGQTRCEDFPCCGHTDGDGCIPRPEHTSEYWRELYAGIPVDEWPDSDD